MQKVITGIITYNPELDTLAQTVASISGQSRRLVVIDNGSANLCEMEKLLQGMGKIKIVRNKKNRGMAKALNQLFTYASETGQKWVLVLDQDSVCCDGFLRHMEKFALGRTAVVGPNVIYKNNEAFCRLGSDRVQSVQWVITSGSLIRVEAWRRIGGFDEKLFIDGVDKDFCLRARKKNYDVCKDYGAWILHGLGNLKCKKVAGRVIYVTNHEPWRIYYMVRNAIYLDAKLGLKDAYLDICKMVLKVLLFEKQKVRKVAAILHGIKAGAGIDMTLLN